MGEQRPKSLGILGGARNENVAWYDTERISTGQIYIVGAPSTFGVSRWNKTRH